MRRLGHSGKRDATHNAIAAHLRSISWSVVDTGSVGKNFGDLVVSRLGYTAVVECKSGSDRSAEVQLTEGQREFRNQWQGGYVVASTPEQAESELAARLLGFRLEALKTEDA